jgi:hypothetical protein
MSSRGIVHLYTTTSQLVINHVPSHILALHTFSNPL